MEWKRYKMEELIDEISMGPFGSDVKKEFYVDSGIPILNGSNLQGFKLQEESFGYLTLEKADSLKKSNASRGDIIVTHRGTLGQIVYIPEDSKYDRYVISQSQFRFSCKKDLVNVPYLVYYFHTPIGQNKILSNASQVGVPALARASTTFRQIEIELPPLPIQHRIASILSSLDSKIETNNKINAKLEEMAQALFKSWFVDYEPFKDKGMVESELGMIPEGWRVVSLDEICSFISRGLSPKYDTSTNELVLGQTCVRNNIVTLTNARNHLPKSKSSKKVELWDTLINSTGIGSLGRVGGIYFDKNNVSFDSHLTVVRAKDKLHSIYICRNLLNRQLEIENMAIGSTGQTELPRESVKNMKIILPPDAVIKKFSSFIKPISLKMYSHFEESSRLSLLRDTLLPKLISGEIEI